MAMHKFNRVIKSEDARKAEWVRRAKRVYAIRRNFTMLGLAELRKRISKHVDQYGNTIDYRVIGDDRVAYFKSEEHARRAVLSGFSDDVLAKLNEEEAVMNGLVAPEDVTDEMVDEAKKPDAELMNLAESTNDHA